MRVSQADLLPHANIPVCSRKEFMRYSLKICKFYRKIHLSLSFIFNLRVKNEIRKLKP